MGKADEISYVETVARVENVPLGDFENYLRRKPWSDPNCWEYLTDIAQIMGHLPPAPCRVLDLGCGSGWTTELLAQRGYDAVGVDISEHLLTLAREKLRPGLTMSFHRCDYERDLPPGEFDAAMVFDALHHSDDEAQVIRQVAKVLRPGSPFVILEPGRGHSQTPDSIEVMQKYGTTEKDMPFSHFGPMLAEAGFSPVRQFARTRMAVRVDLNRPVGPYEQMQAVAGLCFETVCNGLTSLVVANRAA